MKEDSTALNPWPCVIQAVELLIRDYRSSLVQIEDGASRILGSDTP